MITEDMIEFWFRNRNHPDLLDRGSPAEQSVLTGEEWTLLEELVASLKLDTLNLTSEGFQQSIEEQLASNVAESAIERLRAIAREESTRRVAI
jgi:hypothetical protein